MRHDNINYLKLTGYNFHIKPLKMIKVFLKSALGKIVPEKEHDEFKVHILQVMSSENNFKISKTVISKKDKTEKKRIIKEIKNFLKTRTHTRKKHNNKHRKKTRKNKS